MFSHSSQVLVNLCFLKSVHFQILNLLSKAKECFELEVDFKRKAISAVVLSQGSNRFILSVQCAIAQELFDAANFVMLTYIYFHYCLFQSEAQTLLDTIIPVFRRDRWASLLTHLLRLALQVSPFLILAVVDVCSISQCSNQMKAPLRAVTFSLVATLF